MASDQDGGQRRPPFGQLVMLFVAALILVNLGCGFDGTFFRLGAPEFPGKMLGGLAIGTHDDSGTGRLRIRFADNRFRGTLLENIPVPFPIDYVRGAAIQQRDFEKPLRSYLLGIWQRGWW